MCQSQLPPANQLKTCLVYYHKLLDVIWKYRRTHEHLVSPYCCVQSLNTNVADTLATVVSVPKERSGSLMWLELTRKKTSWYLFSDWKSLHNIFIGRIVDLLWHGWFQVMKLASNFRENVLVLLTSPPPLHEALDDRLLIIFQALDPTVWHSWSRTSSCVRS